ncbi:MAG: helicase C-terminal domain-containing protein [Anaerolineae bacterium]
MEQIHVALDLEFTGLDPQRDDIIQVGMVKFRGAEVLDTYASLVHSTRTLPFKIQQLVGITPDELRDAPTLRALSGRILTFIGSHPIVGHSVDMDLRFLEHHGLPLNNLPIDTFELATIVLPEAQRYSLANLAEMLHIDLPQQHNALSDATATKDLYLTLIERLAGWDSAVLREIATLTSHTTWALRNVFRDAAERANPSAALAPPPRRRASGATDGTRHEEEVPRLEPTETITPVDAAPLSAMIAPGGVFEQTFEGYEHRPQQQQMLEAVVEALNTPCHLIVEAGTGTGKSLAYLLPSIYFAVQNGRRVVISSNTINLQDQLVNKDVPVLQRILPVSFHVAVLKGRSNYVCLRRLAQMRRGRQVTQEEARLLAKVLAWLPVTRTGDRAELLLVNSDLDLWANLQAGSETCMGDHCMYRQNGQCFFYRARARAERAHLIIVNHALLLSDLALDNRILPEFKYLIVDEAHHLEEQATEQFGINVARRDVYAFLAGLSHEGGDVPSGLLGTVPVLLQSEAISASARGVITAIIETLRTNVDAAQRRLYELFNVLAAFVENHADPRGANGPYDSTFMLTPALRTQPDWSNVEIAWEELSSPFRQILQDLERLSTHVENLAAQEDTPRDELVQEIKAQYQRAQSMWFGMNRILLEPEEEGIYWLALARKDDEVTLCSAPLHVGPILSENLFANVDSVVLTSATLQAENSFRYIEQRLGLEDPLELAVGSPFDFKSSVLLYVPKDMPEPNQPHYQKSVEQAIIDLCIATEGRALALFTSNSQLNATYRAIRAPLEQEGIVVFGQGFDGSRRQILDNFRNTPRSVLLGTRSFWEGVDVVGQALSCLIIARLPFAVPSDPVFAARSETFEDPFHEYSLPDSILRFRQGFGRLIRSREDYGVVVVLDRRLLTKPYGKTILRSLPPCTARQGPLESLPVVAKRWLDPKNRA